MIGVAVIDDDTMLVDGLRTWLAGRDDLRLIATAPTVDALLRPGVAVGLGPPPGGPPPAADGAVSGSPRDVALLDLVLRDDSDPAGNVRRLIEAGWLVLVVSVWSQPRQVADTYAAGARGYLTKDHGLPALADAIRRVAAGDVVHSPELAYALLRDAQQDSPHLSPRERAVLLAYASGMTLATTARHLGIQQDTANTYLKRIKAKYEQVGRPAYTKLDLADRVRQDGLSPGPDT